MTNERSRSTRALLNAAMGQPDYNLAAGNWALNVLGVVDPGRREVLHAWFLAFALEFEHQNYGKVLRPRGREIVDALHGVAKGARDIQEAIELLRRARQTALPDVRETDDYRRDLFRLMVGEVERIFGMSGTDWQDGMMQDPLTDSFAQLHRWATVLADRFHVSDVAGPNRTVHPARVTLIGRLGQLYEDETGRRATASRSGVRPDYQSPFELFVAAFMPIVGIDPPPTTKEIGTALDLYHLIAQKNG